MSGERLSRSAAKSAVVDLTVLPAMRLSGEEDMPASRPRSVEEDNRERKADWSSSEAACDQLSRTCGFMRVKST